MARFVPAIVLMAVLGLNAAATAQSNVPSYPVPPPNMLQIPPPVQPPAPAPPPPLAPIPQIIGPRGEFKAPPGWNQRKQRESFSDRVEQCTQWGAAAGVPAAKLGAFVAQCAN